MIYTVKSDICNVKGKLNGKAEVSRQPETKEGSSSRAEVTQSLYDYNRRSVYTLCTRIRTKQPILSREISNIIKPSIRIKTGIQLYV